MRRMAGETHHGWTGGQQSVAGGGDQSGKLAEQTPRQEKNQECGGGVDQSKPRWIPPGVWPEKARITEYAAKVPGNFML